MGLIGVVLASVVGIFWQSDALQFVISLVGVVVFADLAAYDAQRLGAMDDAMPAGRVGAYAGAGATERSPGAHTLQGSAICPRR
jgi:FtsH-binding integral membrane protein